MSGSDGPALVAAVSAAGALGSLGYGEMTVAALNGTMNEVRSKTLRPFNLSFFAHDPPAYAKGDAVKMQDVLARYYRELGLRRAPTLSASPMRSFDEETLEAVLALEPEIVSFHFGLPADDMLDALRSRGVIIMCSANNVAEARQLDAAAFALGASGVQMGTAFLLCPESAAGTVHREALKHADDDGTVVTRVFTGRPARAAVNQFVAEMERCDGEVAPFPLQDSLTLPVHEASVARGSKDFAALFRGQAAPLGRALPAGQLVDVLVAEAQEVLGRAA